MRAFLEQYGIAIFIIIILGIMTLMANGLGLQVKGLLSQEINKFTQKSNSETEKVWNGSGDGTGGGTEEELIGEAIAIFCEDDGCLSFYRVETVPTVGSTFDNKTVDYLYRNFEIKEYTSGALPPWYQQRNRITTIEFKDKIKPISTAWWFYDLNKVTDIFGLNYLNTKDVKNMSHMFMYCESLTSLEFLKDLNTSKVTDMSYMFAHCKNLTTISLPNSFDTSNVRDMAYMFTGCYNSTMLSLPTSFKTSNVTNMDSMFYYCENVTTISLPSSFNTSNVTNMANMFRCCKNVTTISLPSSFNTSNVTNMANMFRECQKLETLILPNSFNTSKVTNISYMFAYCGNSLVLDCSNWNVDNVTNHNYFNNSSHNVIQPEWN